MSEQKSELIKLFGSLHDAVNKKPWDQMEVSGCLLDITTKFDYDNAKIKELEANLDKVELLLCDEQKRSHKLEKKLAEAESWTKTYKESLSLRNHQFLELVMTMDELTAPFTDSLTMDDLSDHNKMIRKQFNLDLPTELI